MDEVNNLVNKHFPELMRRSPRYKYYEDNKKNRYFYTTEKINCGCKRKPELGHYVCGKYTYKKGKKMYVLTKKKCFAKKHRAIEWARKESGKAIERQTKNRE